MISNKTYNILKHIVMYVLPALATLWSVISETWGIPNGEMITVTINAIATFIGTCCMISTNQYNKSMKKLTNEKNNKK